MTESTALLEQWADWGLPIPATSSGPVGPDDAAAELVVPRSRALSVIADGPVHAAPDVCFWCGVATPENRPESVSSLPVEWARALALPTAGSARGTALELLPAPAAPAVVLPAVIDVPARHESKRRRRRHAARAPHGRRLRLVARFAGRTFAVVTQLAMTAAVVAQPLPAKATSSAMAIPTDMFLPGRTALPPRFRPRTRRAARRRGRASRRAATSTGAATQRGDRRAGA